MLDTFPVGFGDMLRNSFRYDKETGVIERKKLIQGEITWKEVTSRHPAGALLCTTAFGGKQYNLFGARLAFFLTENRWPSKIEYVDGNNQNIKWGNIVEEKAKKFEPVVMEKVQVGNPAWKDKEKPKVRELQDNSEYIKSQSHVLVGQAAVDAIEEVHREDMRRLAAVEECHPVWAEMKKEQDQYFDNFYAHRYDGGLWTGCSASDIDNYIAHYEKTHEALSGEEANRRQMSAIEDKTWFSMDKLDQDYLMAKGMLLAISKGHISMQRMERTMAVYEYQDKPFPAPRSQIDLILKATLAKHGFSSEKQAMAETMRLYGLAKEKDIEQQQAEERVRLAAMQQ